MTDERRAELRQGCAVADMNDNLVVLASDELRSLLDAADRVAALEAEVEAVKESESMLDACADVYQERAFAAEKRIATLEAEVKRLQGMTEHDMLKAWLNRMQEKQAHIQHPDGNTWCEWKCTACGKRIMWSNGDTNDLTGFDIDCVKCCHCGTVHDLRDDYEIRLRPEYRKDDAEETHPCIATLEAELAALKGVNQ